MLNYLNSFNRFFIGVALAIFVSSATIVLPVPAMASAMGAECCCKTTDNIELAISSDCSCCKNVPSHSLPASSFKLQVKFNNGAVTYLAVERTSTEYKVNFVQSRHKPLHLASNQLYLTNRALLI